jgi:hypothetical protein
MKAAFLVSPFIAKGLGSIPSRSKFASEAFRAANTRKETCNSPLSLKAVDAVTKTALCVLAEGVEEVPTSFEIIVNERKPV